MLGFCRSCGFLRWAICLVVSAARATINFSPIIFIVHQHEGHLARGAVSSFGVFFWVDAWVGCAEVQVDARVGVVGVAAWFSYEGEPSVFGAVPLVAVGAFLFVLNVHTGGYFTAVVAGCIDKAHGLVLGFVLAHCFTSFFS